MTSERKLGLDPILDGHQPEILQPLDIETRKRLEFEVGKRTPTP
jgi:hypothetical protein